MKFERMDSIMNTNDDNNKKETAEKEEPNTENYYTTLEHMYETYNEKKQLVFIEN